jgi:hypothetical protein
MPDAFFIIILPQKMPARIFYFKAHRIKTSQTAWKSLNSAMIRRFSRRFPRQSTACGFPFIQFL